MPLCPQISITPVTVTSSNMTVTSVIAGNVPATYEQLSEADAAAQQALADAAAAQASAASALASASAAQAVAASAQATATVALAQASSAYTAAVASLQPSADTIVNASNQITAISGNGITVYSGEGSTSGPRVVLNSLGIAAYGSSSSFNITGVSGNGTSVTYTASGHNFFVGQGVTVSGLAPSGYNGSFIITAVSAGSTFSVANTTTATVTNPNGLAVVSSTRITGVSGNGTNVTYTAAGHTFTVGQSITVSGLAPNGYNGSFVVTSVVAGSSFTVANTTTAAVTDSLGSAERATLAISASTGNAVFSGSVTGSTIIGGTLNIGGNAIIDSSGYLTATGATITGTITATTGSFTGTVVATTGSFTGSVFATTGTFTGTVTATTGSFTGTIVSTTGSIGGWTIGTSSISKVVGTRTTTFNASTGLISINDTNSGFLAGGAISIGTPSITTSISSAGLTLGSDAAFDVLNELGGYTGIPRIYASIGRGIRLVPDAGFGSTTNNVSVEGHLNSIYTLSTGTYTSSSTSQTTGTYLSQTGAMIARRDDQVPMFAHRYRSTTPYTGTTPIEMWRGILDGSGRGSIFCSATGSPSLTVPSDYRLKENIRDFEGAVDMIKSKKLRVFNLKSDPNKTDVVGFIAHEFGDDDSELVIGRKDAVDDDGNPQYQSVAFTNIIPYLVGALKDIILRVEALEGGH